MNTTTSVLAKTKWVLDPAQRDPFKVRHLMISNVKGKFQNFRVDVTSGAYDFSDASINATIDAASVFTNDLNRDAHLRSADCFDVFSR